MEKRPAHGKSLSARMFVALFAVAFVSFLIATAITAYASWTVYEGDAEEMLSAQLDVTSGLIADKDAQEMCEILENANLAETRITLVSGDGVVLFDTLVDVDEMENHAGRQEIEEAREGGESVVLRKSATTGIDALYAATVVDSKGTVLRLGESRTSLAFYLGGIVVPLLIAVLLAALALALLARIITRRVATPILAVDLGAPLESETYREIRPLLSRIDEQRIELVNQNEQLEEAMEMRREFTGNVSHEMKSPLQVIGGYAELIESGIASPEDAKRFAGLIRSESQSMRGLIDDVLMLSKLDEGACRDGQAVDVVGVLSQVIERLSPTAESKGVKVLLSAVDSVFCMGFDSLVEQTAYNLIDNAIRYGGEHIEVDVSMDSDVVRVSVSDDGPGIPESQRARIFERFYRVDPSRSRSTGGTGLGLAIVKHAVESMGGSVSVGDSECGGAKFTVELPAANQ